MRDVRRQFDGILRRCSNRVLPAVQSSRRSAGSGSSKIENGMHDDRWVWNKSYRLENEERRDVPEEHGPNKALVGCYLDSFLRLLILVLAYCVGEKRKFESGAVSGVGQESQNAES
jgi:hypothetical protein